MIDWSKAPEGYNWHAFDYNGRGYFYKDKPELNSFYRWNDKEGTGLMSCMVTIPSYQASLANRPQPTPRLKPTSLVPPTDETHQAGSFDMPLQDGFKTLRNDLMEKHNHYHKNVAHLDSIDVYQVFRLWGTTDHEIEHAIKKLLNAGQRGAKSKRQDVQEAIDTLKRYLEITEDDQ